MANARRRSHVESNATANKRVAATFFSGKLTPIRDEIFKQDSDTKLSAEEAELIATIAEHLTFQSNTTLACKYIEDLLGHHGHAYLHYLRITSCHIKNSVLPQIEQFGRDAESLYEKDPNRWQDHVKAMRADRRTLKSNLASLDYLLDKHEHKNSETLPLTPSIR